MYDYARESALETTMFFYDIEDALESAVIYDVAMEKGEENNSSSGGESDEESSKNKDDGEKSDENTPKTDDPNPGLKKSTGIWEWLRKIIERLKEFFKEQAQKLSKKISDMEDEKLQEFLNKVAESKKNGLYPMEIINYRYKPSEFTKGVNGVVTFLHEYNSKLDDLFNEYERVSAGSVDAQNNLITQFNEKYAHGKVYSELARHLEYGTAEEVDQGFIKSQFQKNFRGGEEKEKFTIDQAYANACESYMRESLTIAREMTNNSNEVKKVIKNFDSKQKGLAINPDTSQELNNAMKTAMGEINEFLGFAVSFWLFAWHMASELRTNCRVVLKRAYKIEGDTIVDKARDVKEKIDNNISAHRTEKNQQEADDAWNAGSFAEDSTIEGYRFLIRRGDARG
jgi:hypothetical protein